MRAILIALLVAAPALAQAPAAPPAPPAADNAATNKVVLTVLGRVYTTADFDPDAEVRETIAEAERRGAGGRPAIYTSERLAKLVVMPLQERFIRENHLDATDEEVAVAARTIRARSRPLIAQALERFAKEIEEAKQRLGDPALDEAARRRIEEDVKAKENLMAMERELSDPDAPPGPGEVSLYRATVTRWKMDTFLYDRYGGRVLFQQFGLEPFDAYRQWFEAEEKAGAFTFAHDGLRDLFYHYFKADHGAFLADEAEGKAMMLKPWWEQPMPAEDAPVEGPAGP